MAMNVQAGDEVEERIKLQNKATLKMVMNSRLNK